MNFTISELCIVNKRIPLNIADKLLLYHIVPMQKVRDILKKPITASLKSGFRPYDWEIANNRSGKSQHCFGQNKNGTIDYNAKGAVDWTSEDLDKLEKLIIKHTEYTRIARYKNFIHCDYKAQDGKRYYFKSGDDSKWQFIKYL